MVRRLVVVCSCLGLAACAGGFTGNQNRVKLYDAVVFEMSHDNVLAPPNSKDTGEFLAKITERTLHRARTTIGDRSKNTMTAASGCGPRTIRFVNDVVSISFKQKGKASFWKPFSATTEVIEELTISTEGKLLDCETGRTIATFSSSEEDDDYADVIRDLANDMTKAATRAQWSR